LYFGNFAGIMQDAFFAFRRNPTNLVAGIYGVAYKINVPLNGVMLLSASDVPFVQTGTWPGGRHPAEK
jgi:hypothetical protein